MVVSGCYDTAQAKAIFSRDLSGRERAAAVFVVYADVGIDVLRVTAPLGLQLDYPINYVWRIVTYSSGTLGCPFSLALCSSVCAVSYTHLTLPTRR